MLFHKDRCEKSILYENKRFFETTPLKFLYGFLHNANYGQREMIAYFIPYNMFGICGNSSNLCTRRFQMREADKVQ